MGIEIGVDRFKLMDAAEEIVVPMMDHPVRIDRDALTLGLACQLYPRSDVTLQVVGKLRKAWQAKRLME